MSEQAGLGSLRVMVVDDDAVNLILAEAILESFGLKPVAVGDPIEAYAALQERDFDLILMDVHMPGMSGLELTDKIRQLERQTGRPRTRIVALTASAMSDELAGCLQHDMDDVLTKPIVLSALKAVLERWPPA